MQPCTRIYYSEVLFIAQYVPSDTPLISRSSKTVIAASGFTYVETVVCAPDDGWRYQPKHFEQFPD